MSDSKKQLTKEAKPVVAAKIANLMRHFKQSQKWAHYWEKARHYGVRAIVAKDLGVTCQVLDAAIPSTGKGA